MESGFTGFQTFPSESRQGTRRLLIAAAVFPALGSAALFSCIASAALPMGSFKGERNQKTKAAPPARERPSSSPHCSYYSPNVPIASQT